MRASVEGRVGAGTRANVVIDPERCKACEICIYACPEGNLALSKGFNGAGYHPVEWSYDGTRGECTGCGVCYWVCPEYAILEVTKDG